MSILQPVLQGTHFHQARRLFSRNSGTKNTKGVKIFAERSMKKWQFCKILVRKLCVPILLTDAKAKYCYLLYPIVAVPKCLSYVHPLHRSNDGRITRLLGQWIDRRSMERSVYISCSHNPIHIKLWSFYPQGGQKAILTKQYCSGPRRRLPWRDLPSHEATRHAAGGRWW